MIVEIHKSSSTMSGTLRYNEDKVRGGVASILCEHGIGSTDIRTINRLFEDRERMSLREAQHLSFQMSVNPGAEDDIREERIPDFVKDLMEGLGYGEQPWVVFRHEDTGRIHYHVVSIRIDADGKKIRDYYEKRACDRLVKGLERKYGYLKGGGVKNTETMKVRSPVFRPGDGDVVKMMQDCLLHSLMYRFTTGRQFAEVMRCHGVLVQEGLGKDDLKVHLSFQGMDESGKVCTASVSDMKMGFDVREALKERMEDGRGKDVDHERVELIKEVASAIKRSDGLLSLTEALKSRGVDIVIYRDKDGIPRGSTLIDHRTTCVFKGSELSRSLGTSILGLASDTAGLDGVVQGKAESPTVWENISFNSGVSEALSLLLSTTLNPESGRKGWNLESQEEKKKKRRKR